MKRTVIVPIYKNQLVILYRQGFNTIDSSRIIFAAIENGIPKIPDGILSNLLPVFEEDFEVLLIEFDLNFSDFIDHNKIFLTPNLEKPLELDFQDVKRIYPLTERGAKSLNLGQELKIKIEKPIFEEHVRKAEFDLRMKGYIKGGFALLTILGLDNSIIKKNEDKLKDHFISAYCFRNNPEIKAGETPKTNDFLIKVLCYERYGGIIPENDLGFLCDVGYIYAQTQSETIKSITESKFVASLITGNENQFRNLNFSQVLNLLNEKYPQVREGMKKVNFNFATYLFYFKIKAILNEGKRISETSLPQIIQDFKDSEEYKNNLVTAIWLAGAFFGFSRFFSEFYKTIDKEKLSPTTKTNDKAHQPDFEIYSSKMNFDENMQDEEFGNVQEAIEINENKNKSIEKNVEEVNEKRDIPFEVTNSEQPVEDNSEDKGDLFSGLEGDKE